MIMWCRFGNGYGAHAGALRMTAGYSPQNPRDPVRTIRVMLAQNKQKTPPCSSRNAAPDQAKNRCDRLLDFATVGDRVSRLSGGCRPNKKLRFEVVEINSAIVDHAHVLIRRVSYAPQRLLSPHASRIPARQKRGLRCLNHHSHPIWPPRLRFSKNGLVPIGRKSHFALGGVHCFHFSAAPGLHLF